MFGRRDIQDSPFQGIGLPSHKEIDVILKLQKKEDNNIMANIQDRETNLSSTPNGRPDRSTDILRRPAHMEETLAIRVGPRGQMHLKVSPYTSYVNVALALTKQHFQYVGGEGGTGKSCVIYAIKDMFRLKGSLHILLLMGASRNTAMLIGRVMLHSAVNIGFEGKNETVRTILEEEKLYWKNKMMLVVDEISQVGGLILASVDSCLRVYRDGTYCLFGGIPIIIFFGNFFQFDLRPESLVKYMAVHKLFRQFNNGFLYYLCNGKQTKLDFQQLCYRLYTKAYQASFTDNLRAVTPLNQDRWNLNMAAIVHLFFYVQGMLVVMTQNQFIGFKVVNRIPFRAVDIFPDLTFDTMALTSNIMLHLGPLAAVFLQLDKITDLGIPGLPNGMILIKSKIVAIPDFMQGKGPRSRGKPGFRWITHRTGPLCMPAFTMTDQKSQGKQFSEKPAWGDFIKPKNILANDIRDMVLRLERLGDKTRHRFKQDYRHKRWFQN
ncbi:hypothetical protein B0T25DRAFT_592226 [Lasiosphaeria hispida]|uniref:ATP-dependent DNA helicase n=1 Tax=Lasiosphaeria hispida TaxID=260671 RepID=A0AAJ0HGA4_9PEZI|nr:hypothetical protein B0T25DRAFT_592226 [Lasiosphaeria hispida]